MGIVDELIDDLGTTEVTVAGRKVPLKIPLAEESSAIWKQLADSKKDKSNEDVLLEITIVAMTLCLGTDRERASKLLAVQPKGMMSPLAVACRGNCGLQVESGSEANPTAA